MIVKIVYTDEFLIDSGITNKEISDSITFVEYSEVVHVHDLGEILRLTFFETNEDNILLLDKKNIDGYEVIEEITDL